MPEPQARPRARSRRRSLVRLVDTNGRTGRAQPDAVRCWPTSTASASSRSSTTTTASPKAREAGFDIIVVAPTGETIDKAGLNWTLSRIETNYQWYRQSGIWKWEAITTTREVANGTVDATADGSGHRRRARSSGARTCSKSTARRDPTSSSYEFYAGYYYPEAGSDTPDTLQVALDKERLPLGETANLKLDPQFAGTALVMVVDNRIIDMQAVEVPAEGTTVPLTGHRRLGSGRLRHRDPLSSVERRRKAHAGACARPRLCRRRSGRPQARRRRSTAPEEALPRQAFTVDGQARQRRGRRRRLCRGRGRRSRHPQPHQLQGARSRRLVLRPAPARRRVPRSLRPADRPDPGRCPARIRSGGDGGAARLGTPPPTSVLVAQHSGIVEGRRRRQGHGHLRHAGLRRHRPAHGDGLERDRRRPCLDRRDRPRSGGRDDVSPPRFLRLDDTSRLLVEINNVSGPAGDYKVELLTGEGLATDAAETDRRRSPTGERTVAQPRRSPARPSATSELRLLITGPTAPRWSRS